MEWYGKYYKALFLIPIVLILISAGIIFDNVQDTGSFVRKGVSLSGGVSTTVTLDGAIDANTLEEGLRDRYSDADIDVRSLNTFSTRQTFIIDAADISEDPQNAANMLESTLRSSPSFNVLDITTETTGPSLGESFFVQTIIGILLAFLWMGWVVYLYFGDKLSIKILVAIIVLTLTILSVKGVLSGSFGMLILALLVLASMIVYLWVSVPSGAVILAAASTILFTLAVIDLIGLRLSTAGVAAFLMLIGYSVDTDILLSTRVLKNPHEKLLNRIKNAAKTGLTMQVTTTVAVLSALLLSSSEVIRQIMLIIFIGMIGDIIFTWLQNAGIIYWYELRQQSAAEPHSHKKSARRNKK